MAYDFSSLKNKIQEIEEWFKGELATVRTGRATPMILDGVVVESYGSKLPLAHVAGITTEDARTLRVVPWDKSQLKEVEKAIIDANLGVSVNADDSGVRVSFPELTSERREALSKLARGKLEEGRISLRNARDEVWNDIQARTKSGEISEDDKFRFKEDMEKLIADAIEKLEAMTARKEKEITS